MSCRYYRVPTMVYNTQKYWVFGLCLSSGFFLNTKEKKNNVSETGSVSVFRWGKTPTLLGPLERANLNHWTNWGRKQIQFPKRCFFSLVFRKIRTMDKVRKPNISVYKFHAANSIALSMRLCWWSDRSTRQKTVLKKPVRNIRYGLTLLNIISVKFSRRKFHSINFVALSIRHPDYKENLAVP
jgi:hypothetical protein